MIYAPRIAIVGGAGGVGSSTAYNLLARDEPYDVVIVDRRPAKVASHVMDLEQVVALHGGAVRAGELGEIASADVVVVSAAAPQELNTSRMVHLRENAAIVAGIADALGPGWPGVLVMVTNPVDVLCTWLRGRTGLPRERVVGYTLNDSLRLRTAAAARLGVAPADVEAWVIGEHGDQSVPLLGRISADGGAASLSEDDRAACAEFVRGWYRRHVALDPSRSSTWTSGAGVARLVAALGAGSGALWPASVGLEGEYGVEGVSLTVPVTLGAGGVREIHQWPLSADEAATFARGAQTVADAAAALG